MENKLLGKLDHLQTAKRPTQNSRGISRPDDYAQARNEARKNRRERKRRREEVKETMFTPHRRQILLPERVVKAKESVEDGHMRRKREKLAV